MAVNVHLIDTTSYSGRLENVNTNATALSRAAALKSRFAAFYIAKLQKKKVPLGRRGRLSLPLVQSCYRNWVSFSLKPWKTGSKRT
jgi:hypothetical protein